MDTPPQPRKRDAAEDMIDAWVADLLAANPGMDMERAGHLAAMIGDTPEYSYGDQYITVRDNHGEVIEHVRITPRPAYQSR